MTRVTRWGLAAVVSLMAAVPAGAQSVNALVAQAVRPIPEDLRAEATVYRYDAETGERVVLRQGTNQVECIPKNPETGYTRCFAVTTADRRDLDARLSAQGVSGEALDEALAEAEAEGRIRPTTFGSMRYRLYEEGDRIQLLWMVSLPGAMASDLAMPTASQRDSSLAGQGKPWMMLEGTPRAHLMIPINGTEWSNPGGARSRLDTKAITDPLEEAVLPLPEDLRDGATIVTYDENGDRRVLRQGTNTIECWPRNLATGYTRCYHESQGPERDLQAKIEAFQAQGQSEEAIAAAVAAAREAVQIPATPFGSLAYRLYEEDDRLNLLWMVRVPNATSRELGMPTGSQRDSSLAGRGTPWMMREGTPAAHLMIPINGTELSN